MNEKLLRTAQLLGLECSSRSGHEAICTCPFCGKEKHFYWNVEKSVGHCKVCDAKPCAMGLLAALLEDVDDQMTPERMKELAEDRGLPVEAFQGYDIVYTRGRYILPVWGFDGQLASLRSYRLGETLMIMGGCPAALFGASRLVDPARTEEHVFVCEGEWDAIAFDWFLRKLKQPRVVVGVPGANTFKPEWVSAFKGRWVHLGYDNDKAGLEGMAKVSGMLAPHVSALALLFWSGKTPVGYDLRDYVISKLNTLT